MILRIKRLGAPILSFVTLSMILLACVPKETVVFKGVKNISVEPGGESPVLSANATFYNPNKVKMKLKEINIDVLVNGKQSAKVKQSLKLPIPAQSDFTVPLVAQLQLKDIGLLDTIVNLLGGKKYEIHYSGYIRVVVHGVTIKVPVDYKEELRLRF
jgi:LEA14-like dessication related protein